MHSRFLALAELTMQLMSLMQLFSPRLSPISSQKEKELYLEGRYGDSLAIIERAVDLVPGDPELCCMKGGILYRLGRYDEALASYQQAERTCRESEPERGHKTYLGMYCFSV